MKKNRANRDLGSNTKNPKSLQEHQYTAWCFTLFFNRANRANRANILKCIFDSECNIYCFQDEICPSTEKIHFQGVIKLKTRMRMTQLKKFDPEIHWEPCKNFKASLIYCSDPIKRHELVWTKGFNPPEKLIYIKPEDFYEWQTDLINYIEKTKNNNREIIYIYDKNGNSGKTAITKYLCIEKNAISLSGKTADMFYACTIKPKIIIIDCPRSNIEYLNYTAIEKLKDGIFFSNKYESKMIIMNSPILIIFANEPPITCKMSEDRWRIIDLENYRINNLKITNEN